MTIPEARKKIQAAIDKDGPYIHNLIGLTLSAVAEKNGVSAANKLIAEFDIEEKYGIRQQPLKEENKNE